MRSTPYYAMQRINGLRNQGPRSEKLKVPSLEARLQETTCKVRVARVASHLSPKPGASRPRLLSPETFVPL